MPGTNTRHRLLHSLNLEQACFFWRRFKLFLGQCTEDTNCLCRAFKVRKWNKCLPCSDFQPLFVLNPLCVSWVELGTRQFFSFSTTTTRQRNRAAVTSKIQKNVKALMSKKSDHNEDRQTGYCNYQLFLDLKNVYSYVVAAMLSRAQLWFWDIFPTAQLVAIHSQFTALHFSRGNLLRYTCNLLLANPNSLMDWYWMVWCTLHRI